MTALRCPRGRGTADTSTRAKNMADSTDEIVLNFLRQTGVELDDDIASIGQLESAAVVARTWRTARMARYTERGWCFRALQVLVV